MQPFATLADTNLFVIRGRSGWDIGATTMTVPSCRTPQAAYGAFATQYDFPRRRGPNPIDWPHIAPSGRRPFSSLGGGPGLCIARNAMPEFTPVNNVSTLTGSNG